jgi:hypothetical protein
MANAQTPHQRFHLRGTSIEKDVATIKASHSK